MESYIVRLNRWDAGDPQKMAGKVENVSKQEKREFRSIEELMSILSTLPIEADYTYRVD